MESPSPTAPAGSKSEKGKARAGRPLKALEVVVHNSKADEELARKLHEELNGPDASSPVAAATRRSRKAPAFYSPQDEQKLEGEEQQQPQAPPPEKPVPSASKKASKKGQPAEEPVDQPPPTAALRSKSRSGDGNNRTQVAEEPAIERKPPTRSTRSAGDSARAEEAKAAPSGRTSAETSAAGAPQPSNQHSDQEQEASKPPVKPPAPIKVPKLPMCRQGSLWYRARKVEENKTKVLLEFPGVASLQPLWLPKDSSRIWTGSYKGKDWRHLGEGAWEPKPKEESPVKKAGGGRGRKRKGPAGFTSEEEVSEEEEDADHKSEAAAPTELQHATVKAESGEVGKPGRRARPPAKKARRGAAPPDRPAPEVEPQEEPAATAAASQDQQMAVAGDSVDGNEEQESQRDAVPGASEDNARLTPEQEQLTGATSEEIGCGASDAAADEAAAALLSVVGGDMCEEERQGSEEPLAEDRPGSESSMRMPGTGLGALAEALASNARKQQLPPAKEEPEGEPLAARAPGKPGSRKRKRGQPKQAVEPPAAAASGSGGSQPASVEARPQDDTPSGSHCAGEDTDGGEGKTRDGWRTSFKAKHLRRLEELEAEDEAAEGQELLSEEQAEAAEAQPTKRTGRAIRSQRPPAARSEPLATRSSRDTEARDSPPPPVTRRAGRGRGRWANHVKRGTGRGSRPTAAMAASAAGGAEGRRTGRGRRSGRWAARTPVREVTPEDVGEDERPPVDLRAAFHCIVGALSRKAAGLPFQGFPASTKVIHPCRQLLAAAEEKFEAVPRNGGLQNGWSFAIQHPPVRLFK